FATGAKYESAPSCCASNAALAATASLPRYVDGASPAAASTGAARRTARWTRLYRWSPMVAPAVAARERTRSSTAPLVAPTMWTSLADAEWLARNARASSSRRPVAEDSTTRMMGDEEELARAIGQLLPGRRAGSP